MASATRRRRFDVSLAREEATVGDGDYLITVQIQLCFADGDLCYASGYETLRDFRPSGALSRHDDSWRYQHERCHFS